MGDTLEARLAALPEVIADVVPYGEWLRRWQTASECCVTSNFKNHGCTSACLYGISEDQNYYWHGTDEPTPETLVFFPEDGVASISCECGMRWFNAEPFHVAITLDEFDEATERARLVAL